MRNRQGSVRSLAHFAFAVSVAVPLFAALGACGGRVDLDEPRPGPSATATSTSVPTGTATVIPTTTSVPPDPSLPPPPPPPVCDPAACALPHAESATCVAGQCVPATCEAGFANCDGNPKNGCEAELETTYPDEDGDGFGDGTRPSRECPKSGVAYVTNGDDCYDQSFYARPGQTAFFSQDRGDGSYDYDCNGTSDLRASGTHDYCLCSDLGCSIDEGWIVTVPACGDTGTWARARGGFSCEPIPEQRAQACR